VTKLKIPQETIQEAIDLKKTMLGAAAHLKVHFNTFKRIALSYGIYQPNPAGKGVNDGPRKNKPARKVEDALIGMYPTWPTYQLKLALLKKGILENKCAECGITDWQGKPLAIELDHIDGDSTNHKLENLRMLCPNCHSQTPTFRSKKRDLK
jgi:hypothetical protein